MRRVPEIVTLQDNERFCRVISSNLREHLSVIPRLAIGILECQDLMRPAETDQFMNTLLRARVSHFPAVFDVSGRLDPF